MAGFLNASAADKHIVVLAGAGSHGSGAHAHEAGCLLFKACLDQVPGVKSAVYTNGWPADPRTAFADAAAVVVYSDGSAGHPLLQGDRLETIRGLMKRGVGLACLHWAVEPIVERGNQEFLEWLGGCFEQHWSVNPSWDAEFKMLPAHPVTRGVKPFKMNDEWYYHMRFQPGMRGVTPILSAVAPVNTLERPDGPYSGNPVVRETVSRGELQHVAWVYERPDGGRGFGFTGGHFHHNWGDENFRKLVMNALLWVAQVDVPISGMQCEVAPALLGQRVNP